ncbi:polyadenylation and cleavage factor homolog 4 isoform X2 [Lotus japonicus]|uniref:polyadenylation and cleavage factor homolog 4 isoform X2 n=1 Tax=Lotus japonicus TaxID=34305 RepID=UPI002583F9C4|nr:polyadenylation and cleavage factor homolog 4 isoform X2 [Lotus japonicus]
MSSNDMMGQKLPPPTLVDRFKALLRRRDDDPRFRASEEIVQIYELLLSELTCNLKPIITDLTIIAEQQREHAEGIADAICTRILEVHADQKLPSLYLLDSIVKNVGQEYVKYFSLRLPEVFCEAYRQVQPHLHSAMRHLFGTWSKVFSAPVLRKIEAQLQFSRGVNNQPSNVNPLRTSESPRPTHGIHVNPKYVGGERLDSTGTGGNTSFGLVANKIHQFGPSRHGRSSSPSRIGIDMPLSTYADEYPADNSTGRTIERESPHHAVDYGVVKTLGREEELSEWQRKQFSGDSRKRFQTMTYSLSNGQQRQSPRALIDAYGSDKSQETSSSKPFLVKRLGRNGIDKVSTTSWQNTEEEEFDWEDMSPTLVEHNRNNGFLQSTTGFTTEMPVTVAANAISSEQDTRTGWSSGSQLLPVDDSSVIAEDVFASSAYSRVPLGQVSGFQNPINQSLGSGQRNDAWKISSHPSNSTRHPFNVMGGGRNLLMPPIDNIPNTDVNSYGARLAASRMLPGLKSNVEGGPPPVLPATFEMRPSVNVHAARPPSLNPAFQFKNNVRFESINANNNSANHGPNNSLLMREQSLYNVEDKDFSKGNLYQLPNQQSGLVSSNPQNRGQAPQLQFFPSQDPAASQFSGSSFQGHGGARNTHLSNAPPNMPFPLPGQNMVNNSLHFLGGALRPLHPARPPLLPHPNHTPLVSSQRPTVPYSNLFSSLVAQGVISFPNQAPAQDSVGIEFNLDILKVRHESAISALYGDLPRQCTTCGLRFKCQDEHSNHMDWHVTKNRMSKNRKQKPSRKWFVSERMWLSGAEALGTESAPGFLPNDTVEEKKDDEELAVPADEDQNTCALCGEPFDEFYSDETEEWMYRGAVYLNAPNGTTAGLDRSQLGPIIHAKCRSESSVAPSDDFVLDEGGTTEEGGQRKRIRS